MNQNICDSNATTETSALSDSKKLILHKASIAIEKCINKILQRDGIDLTEHEANVFVAIDGSFSMDKSYLNGEVQKILTRILPLAQRFDKDGKLQVYWFNTVCVALEPMTLNNFENYVQEEILNRGCFVGGGAKYSTVINKCVEDAKDSKIPTLVLFITDGNNLDKNATDEALRKSSKTNVFFQFIGVGNAEFKYLESLDKLDGRDIDNTSYLHFSSFKDFTNKEMYQKVLGNYPSWLAEISK